MKTITKQLKNVTLPKETFKKFLYNFNTLKKLDNVFYAWDDRRVDFNMLIGKAKLKGITKLPTKDELDSLL